MTALIAALAATLAALALAFLLALRRARTPPSLITSGEGPPLLLVAAPRAPIAPFAAALEALAGRYRLVALDRARPGQAERAAVALTEKPIVAAHGAGALAALRLGHLGRVRGVVLIAPPPLKLRAADVLFPPTIILADGRAHLRALTAALPTVERIAAPGLGLRPERRRPDLVEAALSRLEEMIAEAGG
ncbi:MAG: hypothetical protein AB7L65_02365 [Hyphomonadaceae bacterium]